MAYRNQEITWKGGLPEGAEHGQVAGDDDP